MEKVGFFGEPWFSITCPDNTINVMARVTHLGQRPPHQLIARFPHGHMTSEEEMVRRVLACVNLMDGISTQLIDSKDYTEIFKQIRKIHKIRLKK